MSVGPAEGDAHRDLVDLEHFKIRREMIVHEDRQVNERLGFQLMTQSLLLTGTILLMNNQMMNSVVIATSIIVVAIVGFLLGFVFHLSIRAARIEQMRVRGQDSEMPSPTYDDEFPLPDGLRSRLQAVGTPMRHGSALVPWVCWTMTLVWIPLIALGAALALAPDLIRVRPPEPVAASATPARPNSSGVAHERAAGR